MKLRQKLTVSLTAILLSTSVLAAETTPKKAEPEKPKHDTYEMLNLFGEVFERVKEDYVEPVSDQDLIENALNGMLSSLDPHSGYLNEKAFSEMQVQTKGEFGGLGIEVTMDNGLVKVVSPIDDTPAFKAGIKAGDYISHINGEAVMGMTLSDAVEKMRGPVGSKVTLTVLREGASEPMDKILARDVIKIKAVKAKLINDDIIYVRLASFSENLGATMKSEIFRLQKQAGKNLKGYVIDLRNNPGGLLDQAVEVSDAFLDSGEIVSTRGRTADGAKRYNATKGDVTNGKPIVVLINGGTASASEIVSGALQDHHRAVIMGTKSFGKGSVQTVIPLTGYGAMRLTTSRYYTPSGRSIQAEGITPDIEVKQATKIEYEQVDKFMRNEASLGHHLENPDDKDKDKDDKKGDVPASQEDNSAKIMPLLDKANEKFKKPGDKDKTEEPPTPTMTEGDPDKDYQLARALDLIRGLNVWNKKD